MHVRKQYKSSFCYKINIALCSQFSCKIDSQNDGIWRGILWKIMKLKWVNTVGTCCGITNYADEEDSKYIFETSHRENELGKPESILIRIQIGEHTNL